MKVDVPVRIAVSAAVVALGIGSLAGCSIGATPTPTQSATASATPTTEPTPTDAPKAFTMPSDCTTILPKSIVRELAKDNVTLLAGPGGKYGNELITDPTPEMTAGGISCYFGIDNADVNQLEIRWLISAVAIDSTTRPDIIANLSTQGLNQSTDEAGDDTFGDVGSANGQNPATYNVVASDSWISVIAGHGGSDLFAQAVILATDVHAANYK
jgi:hypothetical protein